MELTTLLPKTVGYLLQEFNTRYCR